MDKEHGKTVQAGDRQIVQPQLSAHSGKLYSGL